MAMFRRAEHDLSMALASSLVKKFFLGVRSNDGGSLDEDGQDSSAVQVILLKARAQAQVAQLCSEGVSMELSWGAPGVRCTLLATDEQEY